MKKTTIEVLVTVLIVLGCVLVAYADIAKSKSQTQVINEAMQSVVAVWSEHTAYPASGFYIGEGVIVTAGHVAEVEGVNEVVFEDGTRCKVLERIAHGEYDCGFLIIESVNKPALKFDDEVLLRGDTVYLLGNPLDMKFFVSKGIVSGRNECYKFFGEVQLIGHDANMASGSSGGLLIDTEGEIVGVQVGTSGSTFGFAVSKEDILTALNTMKQRSN
jgi:S1-C subfamily serine protease